MIDNVHQKSSSGSVAEISVTHPDYRKDFDEMRKNANLLFSTVMELPSCSENMDYHFKNAFDAYSNLWMYQIVHRKELLADEKHPLRRIEIGDIANRIGMLYYHYYLRKAEPKYLLDSYAFYKLVFDRKYFSEVSAVGNSQEFLKNFRFLFRFLQSAILLKEDKMVQRIRTEYSNLLLFAKQYLSSEQFDFVSNIIYQADRFLSVILTLTPPKMPPYTSLNSTTLSFFPPPFTVTFDLNNILDRSSEYNSNNSNLSSHSDNNRDDNVLNNTINFNFSLPHALGKAFVSRMKQLYQIAPIPNHRIWYINHHEESSRNLSSSVFQSALRSAETELHSLIVSSLSGSSTLFTIPYSFQSQNAVCILKAAIMPDKFHSTSTSSSDEISSQKTSEKSNQKKKRGTRDDRLIKRSYEGIWRNLLPSFNNSLTSSPIQSTISGNTEEEKVNNDDPLQPYIETEPVRLFNGVALATSSEKSQKSFSDNSSYPSHNDIMYYYTASSSVPSPFDSLELNQEMEEIDEEGTGRSNIKKETLATLAPLPLPLPPLPFSFSDYVVSPMPSTCCTSSSLYNDTLGFGPVNLSSNKFDSRRHSIINLPYQSLPSLKLRDCFLVGGGIVSVGGTMPMLSRYNLDTYRMVQALELKIMEMRPCEREENLELMKLHQKYGNGMKGGAETPKSKYVTKSKNYSNVYLDSSQSRTTTDSSLYRTSSVGDESSSSYSGNVAQSFHAFGFARQGMQGMEHPFSQSRKNAKGRDQNIQKKIKRSHKIEESDISFPEPVASPSEAVQQQHSSSIMGIDVLQYNAPVGNISHPEAVSNNVSSSFAVSTPTRQNQNEDNNNNNLVQSSDSPQPAMIQISNSSSQIQSSGLQSSSVREKEGVYTRRYGSTQITTIISSNNSAPRSNLSPQISRQDLSNVYSSRTPPSNQPWPVGSSLNATGSVGSNGGFQTGSSYIPGSASLSVGYSPSFAGSSTQNSGDGVDSNLMNKQELTEAASLTASHISEKITSGESEPLISNPRTFIINQPPFLPLISAISEAMSAGMYDSSSRTSSSGDGRNVDNVTMLYIAADSDPTQIPKDAYGKGKISRHTLNSPNLTSQGANQPSSFNQPSSPSSSAIPSSGDNSTETSPSQNVVSPSNSPAPVLNQSSSNKRITTTSTETKEYPSSFNYPTIPPETQLLLSDVTIPSSDNQLYTKPFFITSSDVQQMLQLPLSKPSSDSSSIETKKETEQQSATHAPNASSASTVPSHSGGQKKVNPASLLKAAQQTPLKSQSEVQSSLRDEENTQSLPSLPKNDEFPSPIPSASPAVAVSVEKNSLPQPSSPSSDNIGQSNILSSSYTKEDAEISSKELENKRKYEKKYYDNEGNELENGEKEGKGLNKPVKSSDGNQNLSAPLISAPRSVVASYSMTDNTPPSPSSVSNIQDNTSGFAQPRSRSRGENKGIHLVTTVIPVPSVEVNQYGSLQKSNLMERIAKQNSLEDLNRSKNEEGRYNQTTEGNLNEDKSNSTSMNYSHNISSDFNASDGTTFIRSVGYHTSQSLLNSSTSSLSAAPNPSIPFSLSRGKIDDSLTPQPEDASTPISPAPALPQQQVPMLQNSSLERVENGLRVDDQLIPSEQGIVYNENIQMPSKPRKQKRSKRRVKRHHSRKSSSNKEDGNGNIRHNKSLVTDIDQHYYRQHSSMFLPRVAPVFLISQNHGEQGEDGLPISRPYAEISSEEDVYAQQVNREKSTGLSSGSSEESKDKAKRTTSATGTSSDNPGLDRTDTSISGISRPPTPPRNPDLIMPNSTSSPSYLLTPSPTRVEIVNVNRQQQSPSASIPLQTASKPVQMNVDESGNQQEDQFDVEYPDGAFNQREPRGKHHHHHHHKKKKKQQKKGADEGNEDAAGEEEKGDNDDPSHASDVSEEGDDRKNGGDSDILSEKMKEDSSEDSIQDSSQKDAEEEDIFSSSPSSQTDELVSSDYSYDSYTSEDEEESETFSSSSSDSIGKDQAFDDEFMQYDIERLAAPFELENKGEKGKAPIRMDENNIQQIASSLLSAHTGFLSQSFFSNNFPTPNNPMSKNNNVPQHGVFTIMNDASLSNIQDKIMQNSALTGTSPFTVASSFTSSSSNLLGRQQNLSRNAVQSNILAVSPFAQGILSKQISGLNQITTPQPTVPRSHSPGSNAFAMSSVSSNAPLPRNVVQSTPNVQHGKESLAGLNTQSVEASPSVRNPRQRSHTMKEVSSRPMPLGGIGNDECSPRISHQASSGVLLSSVDNQQQNQNLTSIGFNSLVNQGNVIGSRIGGTGFVTGKGEGANSYPRNVCLSLRPENLLPAFNPYPSLENINPLDIIPFTRRPFFMVVDSDASRCFSQISRRIPVSPGPFHIPSATEGDALFTPRSQTVPFSPFHRYGQPVILLLSPSQPLYVPCYMFMAVHSRIGTKGPYPLPSSYAHASITPSSPQGSKTSLFYPTFHIVPYLPHHSQIGRIYTLGLVDPLNVMLILSSPILLFTSLQPVTNQFPFFDTFPLHPSSVPFKNKLAYAARMYAASDPLYSTSSTPSSTSASPANSSSNAAPGSTSPSSSSSTTTSNPTFSISSSSSSSSYSNIPNKVPFSTSGSSKVVCPCIHYFCQSMLNFRQFMSKGNVTVNNQSMTSSVITSIFPSSLLGASSATEGLLSEENLSSNDRGDNAGHNTSSESSTTSRPSDAYLKHPLFPLLLQNNISFEVLLRCKELIERAFILMTYLYLHPHIHGIQQLPSPQAYQQFSSDPRWQPRNISPCPSYLPNLSSSSLSSSLNTSYSSNKGNVESSPSTSEEEDSNTPLDISFLRLCEDPFIRQFVLRHTLLNAMMRMHVAYRNAPEECFPSSNPPLPKWWLNHIVWQRLVEELARELGVEGVYDGRL